MKPDRIVDNSLYPVIAKLCLSFIDRIQGADNPYPYKRFNTLRTKVSDRKLIPLVDKCIRESVMECSIDNNIKGFDNTSVKNHLNQYIMNNIQYEPVAV